MRVSRLLAIAGLLVLAGCAASRNPVGPESEAVVEPRLLGDWVAEDGDNEWRYLHIIAHDEGAGFDVVAAGTDWAVLSGHLTAVGDRWIASLRATALAPEAAAELAATDGIADHPWSFAAIAIGADGRLTVAYPAALLHAAVKDGRLAGTTSGDYDVMVDADSAAIAEVLRTVPSDRLFAEPQVYRRP